MPASQLLVVVLADLHKAVENSLVVETAGTTVPVALVLAAHDRGELAVSAKAPLRERVSHDLILVGAHGDQKGGGSKSEEGGDFEGHFLSWWKAAIGKDFKETSQPRHFIFSPVTPPAQE
ncbi:MAG: hypothetical protein JOS17DRAFT_794376 [Linnemannia elongata]|nr:MAG: hypothetical protein JOS17DRAFT_794376 [Linnemannia elongata]